MKADEFQSHDYSMYHDMFGINIESLTSIEQTELKVKLKTMAPKEKAKELYQRFIPCTYIEKMSRMLKHFR